MRRRLSGTLTTRTTEEYNLNRDAVAFTVFKRQSHNLASTHNRMANHRITEHFFRRIEDTLATIVHATHKDAVGLEPPPGRTATTLCNDLTIGLKTFLKRKWASVKLSPEDAAAFNHAWVLRASTTRNIVYVASRKRSHSDTNYNVPYEATPVTITNDASETQLAQRVDINSEYGRRVALAAATLFNANYLVSPVGFIGHVDAAFEVELRGVYPGISVLNDTHPTYGNITMIL